MCFPKVIYLLQKNGLSLFANSVLPSLLPFFIATELLSYTGIIEVLGKVLNKFMRPIFNVPGVGAFAFIMGIISGYPIGAKIVTNFRQNGICTKEEGERLLAFTNNSGPLFIIGTVGISLFFDTRTGILLFLSHLLACISVGIVFRFWKRNTRADTRPAPTIMWKHLPTYKNKFLAILQTWEKYYLKVFLVLFLMLL